MMQKDIIRLSEECVKSIEIIKQFQHEYLKEFRIKCPRLSYLSEPELLEEIDKTHLVYFEKLFFYDLELVQQD